MHDFWITVQSEWAIRAFITASMIGVSCGLIGTYIVLRNMALIGDALSHSILPGIYFAFVFVGYSTIGFFVGSVVAGIITAIAITWLQQHIKTKADAAIGIVFTAMFSIGVMGISSLNNKQGNHLDLKDFLFGNVLGISTEDIWLSGLIMMYTIVCVVLFYRYFFISTFQPIIADTMGISTKAIHYFLMLILSFAVVSALRSVGVILVVAMLITPASTALLLTDELRKVLFFSALVGLLSAIVGFCLAIAFDTTPGPAMVLAATFLYILAALFSPIKGLLPIWWRSRNESRRIVQEDILKYLNAKKSHVTPKALAEYLGLSLRTVQYEISKLKKEELIKNASELQLSTTGAVKAESLVRAHRLWESYQVTSMGLDQDKIHLDAERLEHHLTDDFLDELDRKLGFPEKDPHGSPIALRVKGISLANAKLGPTYTINQEQPSKQIEAFLWEQNLNSLDQITLKQKLQKVIEIKTGKRHIKIPNDVAKYISLAPINS